MYKRVSFAERLANKDLGCHAVKGITTPDVVKVLKRNKKIVKGRVVTHLDEIEEDPRANFEGLSVSDFNMEVMQLAGTVGINNVCSLSGSNLRNIDSMVNTLSVLDNE